VLPFEGEIGYANRIRKMAQPATEQNQRKSQNGYVRQCKGAGGRKNEGIMRRTWHLDYLMVPYSPSSNGVAKRLVVVTTSGTRAMLRDSGLPPLWAEMVTSKYLRSRTEGDEQGRDAI